MQLLQAALLNPPQAAEAFQTWHADTDLDHLPPGQHELLPLLYRSLARLGVEHPWLGRLKGVYRRTWYANQLALRTLVGVLAGLEAGSIPTLVAGGAALALTVYPEPAQRPIGFLEIVVPLDLAGAAIQRLADLGWQPTAPAHRLTQADFRAWRPGQRFTNGQGQTLQLWWRVLPAAPSNQVDAEFWDRALPLAIENKAAHTLDPTDQLLRVCLTAARHTPIGLADAARLIHCHPIDWPRLLAAAQKYRLGLPLVHSLSLLTDTLHSPIPPEILKSLRQIPVRPYEQRAYAAFLTPPARRSLAQRFWLQYVRYRRAAEYAGLPRNLLSFGRYAFYAWQARQRSN